MVIGTEIYAHQGMMIISWISLPEQGIYLHVPGEIISNVALASKLAWDITHLFGLQIKDSLIGAYFTLRY